MDDACVDAETQQLDTCNSSPSMRSQAQVCARFFPILKHAKVYRKTTSGFIRKASKGDHVRTILHGVLETEQTVKDDTSWVVKSPAAGETYVITEREFQANYEKMDAGSSSSACAQWPGYLEYRSKRHIRAHQVNENDIKFFQGDTIITQREATAHFIAPWGKPMLVALGDFLAMTHPEQDKIEVYRIERSAFEFTYEESM
jgi:hypothetical protein